MPSPAPVKNSEKKGKDGRKECEERTAKEGRRRTKDRGTDGTKLKKNSERKKERGTDGA